MDNFVDTKNFGAADVIDNTFGTDLANTRFVPDPGIGTATGAALGGKVAGTWGGVTPLRAIGQIVSSSRSAVTVPGLIGFRTLPQLTFTAGVTWAVNAVLIKGAYDAGLLAGSLLRTGINRAASAMCHRGPPNG